jgi:uncharacterized membrane protein (UPF0127 family)
MLFKLAWNLLKNLKWVISIALVLFVGYVLFTQYQAIKASPFGQFLPKTEFDSFSLQSIKDKVFSSPTPTATDASATPTPFPAFTKIAIASTKGTVVYAVEVAQTPEQRAQGLMYRKSLPQYSGMLFIFEYDVQYGFWMKDCEFAQDMLFVNSNWEIVDIKENVPPCKKVDPAQTNCPSYTPKAQYRYVIEVNAGSAKANGIATGQKITLQ